MENRTKKFSTSKKETVLFSMGKIPRRVGSWAAEAAAISH
jgi:hypothetical protein